MILKTKYVWAGLVPNAKLITFGNKKISRDETCCKVPEEPDELVSNLLPHVTNSILIGFILNSVFIFLIDSIEIVMKPF